MHKINQAFSLTVSDLNTIFRVENICKDFSEILASDMKNFMIMIMKNNPNQTKFIRICRLEQIH